jgi:hypothetical protein
MIAIAFAAGLGLGVILGAAIWSGALWLSKLAVTRAMSKQNAAMRQEAIMQQKRIEKAKADLRMQYGEEMTPEQSRIMEQELGKLYKSFPNPKM